MPKTVYEIIAAYWQATLHILIAKHKSLLNHIVSVFDKSCMIGRKISKYLWNA